MTLLSCVAGRVLGRCRYEAIEEADLVILLISDSAMASNHEKVFSKIKKVGTVSLKRI